MTILGDPAMQLEQQGDKHQQIELKQGAKKLYIQQLSLAHSRCCSDVRSEQS